MRIRHLNLILIISLLTIFGCIDENPNLVNPPSQAETIKIRFINLSGDRSVRFLNYNASDILSSEFGFASKSINPPSDSGIVSITNGGISEFKYPRKVKFIRSTYTTFLSLPSPKGAERNKATDTLIYFSSSSGLPVNTVYSYLKLVNAYPDSTVTFTITDGCPNGASIFSNQAFKAVSSQKQVRSGRTPVSVLKRTSAGTEIVGLYDLDLKNDMQYTILISEDNLGVIRVNLLDEHSGEVTALSQPSQIYEKLAFIRTLNFSTESLNIKKAPDEVITQDLSPFHISANSMVSACGSQSADSIVAEFSGFVSVGNTLSMNVNENYTYLVADTKTKRAGFGMVIPEAVVDYQYPEQALIRVVNLDEDADLTLSVAARSDTSAKNYVTGESMCSSLKFGKISAIYPLYLGNSGKVIPLTLFAASSPAKLLMTTRIVAEPGKSYLIVIKKNQSGNLALYSIEDSQQSMPLQESTQGKFFQFVNYLTGAANANVSYSNVLTQAKVPYSLSIASVSDIGQNQLLVDNSSIDFDVVSKYNNIIIACGSAGSPEYISLKSFVPANAMNYSIRRFANAASDVPELAVVLDKEGGDTTARGISYKAVSDTYNENKERSYSLFFYDTQNNKLVYRLNEVRMIHGKVYTFVLGGNAQVGYSVNIVQEY